jgi:SAM-dependent methyltransferase
VSARRVKDGSGLPVPPVGLAARVGVAAGADPMQFYLDEGGRLRTVIEDLLPDDWAWRGKRVLDFGCGAGRVLRHFAADTALGEFQGCDIDGSSIEWAGAHLSPPFRFFRNDPGPPLELASQSLDLIWAMSVFTHITDEWADWLLELHRLLAPGGRLIASFLGEGVWEAMMHSPYDEDEIGMAVSRKWDGPSAWVFHSEWWLREHWGRGFEIERVVRPPRSSADKPEVTHSYIALRKRDVQLSSEVLERIDPRESRELAALQSSLRLAYQDVDYLAQRQAELTRLIPYAARLRALGRRLRVRLR